MIGPVRGPRICEAKRPNGLELSCPAEAGSSPVLYGTMRADKHPRRPSPPGQLQRVVMRTPPSGMHGTADPSRFSARAASAALAPSRHPPAGRRTSTQRGGGPARTPRPIHLSPDTQARHDPWRRVACGACDAGRRYLAGVLRLQATAHQHQETRQADRSGDGRQAPMARKATCRWTRRATLAYHCGQDDPDSFWCLGGRRRITASS